MIAKPFLEFPQAFQFLEDGPDRPVYGSQRLELPAMQLVMGRRVICLNGVLAIRGMA